MRQYKNLIWYMAFLFASILINPFSIYAADVKYPEEKQLNIATVDNRPISIDRLLYTALKDMHYYANISITSSLQQSYAFADSGERDATVSSTPNILELYPNLVQVPVVLDENIFQAFYLSDSGYSISGWEDISGLRAGILTDRVYIASRTADCSSVTQKENTKLLFEGLIKGEYDIVIVSLRAHEAITLPEGIVSAGKIETQPEYLYLNKRFSNLVPSITDALNNVFEDGRGEKIQKDIRVAENDKKKTILYIVSSNIQIPREEQFYAKLREPFENDMSIEWYTVELNSRLFSRDSNRFVYFANLLRQDCVSRDIAGIVVSGDDALSFLKDYYNLYFRNVPVLYYGVINDYETAVRGYEQFFTGIEERLSIAETVSTALELFPKTKNLFVVNDHTTEGDYYREAAELQLAPFSGELNIAYNEDSDCVTLMEHIKELPEDTAVFVGSYFCDINGQNYSLQEMKKLLEKNYAGPVFATHSTDVEYNSAGGKCLDYDECGEIIAGMLMQVLNGEDVKDIPYVCEPENYSRWVFDKMMMDKLGVSEKDLPPGSMIVNAHPSIWESDPRFAVTVVVMLILGVAGAVMITYLLSRSRKQKELIIKDKDIKEVKERLEHIINTAPIAFMMTVDDVVIEANDYMKTNFGIRPGANAVQFYANSVQRGGILDKALTRDGAKHEVIQCTLPSGDTHRILGYVTTTEYGGRQSFILWGVDIEERENQKDQIYSIQQSLQMVIDMLPVAVGIADTATRRIIYANKAAMELFNCETVENITGRSLSDFMSGMQPSGEASTDIVDNMVNSGEFSTELQYFKLTGEIFEARATSCLVDYKGKKSVLVMLQDLTAEKEYQHMLWTTAEKEKEANQLKSRFLVNMSHEIRTPMNAIIGLTEIELRKDPSRGVKEIYKKINISAKNLLDIINDILDLSKIEANKIELYEDEFELEDVFNSAILVATPRLDGKNVEFMLDMSLDLPKYVVGDRTRLWQILKNFLDNSAKYTENGKIVLSGSIDNDHSNNETVALRFMIRDTGIGMDEEQMKKLFLPYEQIKNEAQKRYSGTGLGMAISKQLCEIMGGQMQIDSRTGEGTTIVVNIPFKRAPGEEIEMDAAQVPELTGLSVLAVDDDQLSLDIMSRLLKVNKINCVTAKSGMEAMEIVLQRRDLGEAFDIILLDYMMDGLNGLETARQINLALSKAPKLLMVTAYQKLLLMSELEENGISDLIEKPFIPSQFVRKLSAAMGHQEECEAKPEETFTSFKDANVLLCEDIRLNQEVAAGMFAQFGIVADIAENGRQGVEMLNSGKEYDLIFMDLQMPVMDGYEATQVIRADQKFDAVPIVSLTADAMKEVVDKCLEMGMNDHVAKPIEFSSLQRVFAKWLPESKRVASIDSLPAAKPASGPKNDALARFGGNKALYEKALMEFTRMLPDEWADFADMTEDIEETGRYVHKLKGTAGNLGENEIYRCAIEFERSIRGGNTDKELYEKLIGACDTAKAGIFEQTRKPSGADADVDTGSPEELTELLCRLKEALENYNPIASAGVINALKAKAWVGADEEKLREVCEYAAKYEFDAALETLNETFALSL